MTLKERRSVEIPFFQVSLLYKLLLTYSYLVGDILLDIHEHPRAEHCCRAEAGGSCEDKLVVDESPSTLTTLYGDQCHPGHWPLMWTKTFKGHWIPIPFFLLVCFFYNKFLLALVTLLHCSAAFLKISPPTVLLVIFTTFALAIEVKTDPPPSGSAPLARLWGDQKDQEKY